MVWVWPPHTSMNRYARPGSHSSAIRADRASARWASRNSSTKRILCSLVDRGRSLVDGRFGERAQLVRVGLAHTVEVGQRCGRLLLVDLRHGEADVDQHPVARRDVVEQADVDGA